MVPGSEAYDRGPAGREVDWSAGTPLPPRPRARRGGPRAMARNWIQRLRIRPEGNRHRATAPRLNPLPGNSQLNRRMALPHLDPDRVRPRLVTVGRHNAHDVPAGLAGRVREGDRGFRLSAERELAYDRSIPDDVGDL